LPSRKLPTSFQFDGVSTLATCTRNWRAIPPGQLAAVINWLAAGLVDMALILGWRKLRRILIIGNPKAVD